MDFIGRSRWALAANALTITRIVLAPALAMMILYRNPWWVSFWFAWLLGFTDFLDGRLARRTTPTRVGAFLDPLADKAVVLLAAFALVGIDRFHWLPVALITVREVAIMVYRSYWGRRGLAIPARTSAKYKTFVQGLAIAAALCPAFDGVLWVAGALLWFAVAFTLYSGFQYAWDGRSALRVTGQR
ncbi:MAG: CDP-alcohol phosphatidyltransferase family protein [Acidimicrobiia bacterium]|nr:CDP-alcohol phosphatidyltransferase family protein [Acidimicrobiia bacterium]